MSLPNSDRVAVVIARTRHKMIQAELEEANRRGVKFIELRLDFLAKAVDFARLKEHKHCPWICTFRRTTDGGRNPCKEDERLAVIRQAIVSGLFEWVDLETDIANQIRRFGKVQRIVSFHDMTKTPTELESTYESMLQQDADVLKLAVMTHTASDLERVLKIQKTATRPLVAFGMGEVGFPSRFTALKFGAPWIYGAFNRERGIAPGLPSLDDFRTTYAVRSINEDTKFFGVVGDPVSHSLSPILHNHMYLRTKQNAIYVPIRVLRGTLTETVKAWDAVPFHGYSVTIPHKEDAATMADDMEAFVKNAHTANTLVRRESGGFYAANTDNQAAIDTMKQLLKNIFTDTDPPELNQFSVLILGAGGVARAIVHALVKEGVNVTVANRSDDKAKDLADETGCKAVDWGQRHTTAYDFLVNCTSVGMHPNVNASPFHHGAIIPQKYVFDTVYTPENTLLIKEARERTCQVITGVEMFVRQAAAQFELFTGISPDLEKMREIMRKAMSPVTRALQDEVDEATGVKRTDEAAEDDDDSENTTMPADEE
jgi:3-dehydroquinate dehydratase / shikimate dehydrogenase